MKLRNPRHVIINKVEDKYDLSSLKFPLGTFSSFRISNMKVCKSLLAAGTESSHHMGIVFNEEGVHKFQPPILVQVPTFKKSLIQKEFYNHNATMFKVYVLGENVQVEKRKSIPNLPRESRASSFYCNM